MRKMQEDEFDKIQPTTKIGEICTHDIVKLYIKGTHSDYGCIRCKMKSLVLDSFNRVKGE